MIRPALASDPMHFGRRFVLQDQPRPATARLHGDLRLFATTFAAGFLFVSLLIA
jgi:hypothetical protein